MHHRKTERNSQQQQKPEDIKEGGHSLEKGGEQSISYLGLHEKGWSEGINNNESQATSKDLNEDGQTGKEVVSKKLVGKVFKVP